MQTTAIISPVNIGERADIGIKPGDTVRVWIKVQEKGKIRLQPFEGLVLARKHGNEPGATFTVRKIASGVGVEKIFPLYSPNIDRIEIIRRAKVRRAKLYYIREKAAREIRRQMRKMKLVQISTESDIAARAAAAKKAEEVKAEADSQDGTAQETTQETKTQEKVTQEEQKEEKTKETKTPQEVKKE